MHSRFLLRRKCSLLLTLFTIHLFIYLESNVHLQHNRIMLTVLLIIVGSADSTACGQGSEAKEPSRQPEAFEAELSAGPAVTGDVAFDPAGKMIVAGVVNKSGQ